MVGQPPGERRVASRRVERLVRFGLVGATGLLVNQVALWAVADGFGVHYVAASAVATQVSTAWNFALTEAWVFRASREGRWRRLFLFAAMNNVWMVLRTPILVGLTEWAGLHYLLSNLIALAASTFARFTLADAWIWRGAETREPSSAHRQRMRRYLYDIHGLVRVSSAARLPELAPFHVDVLPSAADLHVEVSSRGFGGLRRRALVEIDRQVSTYVEHLGGLGFAMRVKMGDPAHVQVSRFLRYSPHVLYTNVVEPILRWLMVRKGYVLAHAACLRVNGAGLLITAETDTGKTTTCLRSIGSHGAAFVSDDMTILGPDGVALSYPKPLTISAHTLRAARVAPLRLWRRALLQLQGRLHSKSGRRLGLWLAEHNLPVATFNAVVQMIVPPPKFFIEQLVPEATTVPTLPISHLVVIERGDELTERLDVTEACRVFAANTEDAYGFPPYHLISPGLHNGQMFVEDAIRRRVLERIPVIRIREPHRNWFERLPALLASERSSEGGNGAPNESVGSSVRLAEEGIA